MVSNDDYLRRNLSFSGEWHNRHTTIKGTVRLGSNERGIPGPFGSDPGGTFPGVDRISRGENDTHLIAVDVTRTWTAKFRQRYVASYSAVSSNFVSSSGKSLAINRRFQFRTQLDVSLASNLSLSTGIELQRERAESTFITDAAFNMTPVRRLVAGFFGEARTDWADRLLVSGGLRSSKSDGTHFLGFPISSRPGPTSPSRWKLRSIRRFPSRSSFNQQMRVEHGGRACDLAPAVVSAPRMPSKSRSPIIQR